MIDARKALADLDKAPGNTLAVPKEQMARVLGELLELQVADRTRRGLKAA